MIESVFHSEEVPPGDGFDQWRELLSQAPAPMEASYDSATGFRLYQRDLHLGPVRVWQMEFASLRLRRPPKLVDAADPETYNVCLVLRGSMAPARAPGGQDTASGPYDLRVLDSSRPLELYGRNPDGPVSWIGVEIPKLLLPSLGGASEQVIGRPISGREGIGALLAQFLVRVVADAGSYHATDATRLGGVATDLVSALLTHDAEQDEAYPSPDVRRRTIARRVEEFVRRNLHDPDLSPSTVAAANHISLSYLHRIFRTQGIGISGWIRQQRLERARRDLADPALVQVPVHQIAARWGFIHHAAFTRAFRAAYGIAPRDYRHRELLA